MDKSFKQTGTLLNYYCSFILGLQILFGFILDALYIDLLLIILLVLSGHVSQGSHKAVKWALGISILYMISSLFAIGMSIFQPEKVEWGKYPFNHATLIQSILFYFYMTIVLVWNSINCLWLIKTWKSLKYDIKVPA